ncbi:Mitochondrial inner membrane protease atp23 [Coelomomyces lativittatus]|nr:Mitochondrial inner membrane protease atp23 [Coelomomyces lativittatus]KAJ1514997.1 Mitochondrial inner membrane protease atp23 [Coelomomyces lativittatus]
MPSVNQDKLHFQCEKWKQSLIQSDSKVILLMKALASNGCAFDPDKHIQCITCSKDISGGFSEDFGIALCENQFISKSHLGETLVHELIHAYDHCHFQYDWKNCLHYACTEIRAANLSGDCSFIRELQRGYSNFKSQHQKCVERRAILATSQNPYCSQVAESAVKEVFQSCFNDERPFTS